VKKIDSFRIRGANLDEKLVRVQDRLENITGILRASERRDPEGLSEKTRHLQKELSARFNDDESGIIVRMGRAKTEADFNELTKELEWFDGQLDVLWDYYDDDVPK
jgi:hypothetical protein